MLRNGQGAALVFDQDTARSDSHCDGDKRARLRGLETGRQDALEVGEGTLFEELGCGSQ